MTRPPHAPTADRAPRTDEELLAAVQAQEPHAFQDLRDRHWPTAVAVAGLHTPTGQDAEQLAGTAFDQVLADLSGEDAPEAFLRARLVAVVGRAAARPPHAAEAVSGVYLGLPRDWQAVLWHQDIEDLDPGQAAALLGRSTAALHLEARAGLRAAYRRARLQLPATAECDDLAGDLGALAGGTLTGERVPQVQQHLDDCPRCAADHLYLQDTEAGLRGWLLPVLAGVSPWGAKAEEAAALVRAAGRANAGRPAPGADVAGRSLAAVAVSRRGRQVLLGAGALAAAAALAGFAMVGQGDAGPQAGDRGDGAAVPGPGRSSATTSAGSLAASSAEPEDGPAAEEDSGRARAALSLPTTEPSPGALTESAARSDAGRASTLTVGGGSVGDRISADTAGSHGGEHDDGDRDDAGNPGGIARQDPGAPAGRTTPGTTDGTAEVVSPAPGRGTAGGTVADPGSRGAADVTSPADGGAGTAPDRAPAVPGTASPAPEEAGAELEAVSPDPEAAIPAPGPVPAVPDAEGALPGQSPAGPGPDPLLPASSPPAVPGIPVLEDPVPPVPGDLTLGDLTLGGPVAGA